ncbi:expressed protein [Phakopsora pachyrhizi]|uniref:Expressed protein n=1 Tax=Phakopsora pachyrhizi TaxID=170000 RepID=A0AAV0BNK6_PHAPC|nr:expressed protein [Phakopsora pachyrhizi]
MSNQSTKTAFDRNYDECDNQGNECNLTSSTSLSSIKNQSIDSNISFNSKVPKFQQQSIDNQNIEAWIETDSELGSDSDEVESRSHRDSSSSSLIGEESFISGMARLSRRSTPGFRSRTENVMAIEKNEAKDVDDEDDDVPLSKLQINRPSKSSHHHHHHHHPCSSTSSFVSISASADGRKRDCLHSGTHSISSSAGSSILEELIKKYSSSALSNPTTSDLSMSSSVSSLASPKSPGSIHGLSPTKKKSQPNKVSSIKTTTQDENDLISSPRYPRIRPVKSSPNLSKFNQSNQILFRQPPSNLIPPVPPLPSLFHNSNSYNNYSNVIQNSGPHSAASSNQVFSNQLMYYQNQFHNDLISSSYLNHHRPQHLFSKQSSESGSALGLGGRSVSNLSITKPSINRKFILYELRNYQSSNSVRNYSSSNLANENLSKDTELNTFTNNTGAPSEVYQRMKKRHQLQIFDSYRNVSPIKQSSRSQNESPLTPKRHYADDYSNQMIMMQMQMQMQMHNNNINYHNQKQQQKLNDEGFFKNDDYLKDGEEELIDDENLKKRKIGNQELDFRNG